MGDLVDFAKEQRSGRARTDAAWRIEFSKFPKRKPWGDPT